MQVASSPTLIAKLPTAHNSMLIARISLGGLHLAYPKPARLLVFKEYSRESCISSFLLGFRIISIYIT